MSVLMVVGGLIAIFVLSPCPCSSLVNLRRVAV
jgi:hypothetical protein